MDVSKNTYFWIMRTIIVVDKQDITRVGIETLTGRLSPNSVFQLAESKKELVAQLMKATNPIVIIDYASSDFRSVDELLNVSYRFPEVHWLLFSDDLSSSFLKQLLLMSSKHSVALKSSSLTELNTALRQVLSGQQFICEYVHNQLRQEEEDNQHGIPSALTSTEQEVLKEMALGKTTKEIASDRHLSFHTVTTHRKNIFRKLEVNNVHEATRYAIKVGIIDIAEYYI